MVRVLFLLLTANGALADPAILAGPCTACHGPDGVSPGAIPSIAGRSMDELQALMLAYRADRVAGATVMPRLMRGYDPGQIAELARYFAGLPK